MGRGGQDRQGDDELQRLIAGDFQYPKRRLARRLEDEARDASLRLLGIHETPELPLDNETIEQRAARGVVHKYLPIGADAQPEPAGTAADVFSQQVAEPGWYAMPAQPLDRDQIAELFGDQKSYDLTEEDEEDDAAGLRYAAPRIPPEKIHEYFTFVSLLDDDLPGEKPARLPTFAEAYFMTRGLDPELEGQELPCVNAPSLGEAVSLKIDDGKLYPANYDLNDQHYGVILPIRKVA